MNRPETTLFMLISADGKISTGMSDALDFDKDLPTIDGVKEGLSQYYAIEQTTDLWSLNSGRVAAKIGANEGEMPTKTPVSFVIMDNTHLSAHGVRHYCAKSDKFVLITSNKEHPAFKVAADNLHIIYQDEPDIGDALRRLYDDFDCKRLTVQTGGTLNALLIRKHLIDHVDLVVAPLLVGGKDTPTLIDGESLKSADELKMLGVLELAGVKTLQNSYLRVKYNVK